MVRAIIEAFSDYLKIDRLVKTDRNKLKKVLVILGTIGLVISIAYLFRPEPTPREATIQFRWTILAISICYTLT